MKDVEVLLPAGSLEVLEVAVRYGADAVYVGAEAFSLRAKAKNFDKENLSKGIQFAHDHGVKVYVAANILARNEDIERFDDYLEELLTLPSGPPDALIVSDPGLFLRIREKAPGMEIHISTQSSSMNKETYRFWRRLGASRIVAARELSLKEIREIKEAIPDMEMECFVHGAMCMAHSGRCLLSSHLTGREANRGACAHPCRWKYALVEEKRPGEYMPIEEDEHGTYILNSKDLCMIGELDLLLDAGIDSWKVEGRMKTALYTASVGRAYSMAKRDLLKDRELYYKNRAHYEDEVRRCTIRDFTTGFYFDGEENREHTENNLYSNDWVFLGIVEEVLQKDGKTLCRLHQKNKFSVGDTIEAMAFQGEDISCKVLSLTDLEGNVMESCPHPGQEFYLETDAGEALQVGMVLRTCRR